MNSLVFVFAAKYRNEGKASVAAMCCEAGAAIDRAIGLGLKRDLGGRAALCADGVIHDALAAGSVLAGLPASLAAGGLVLEALFGIELLLAGREGELGAAILANQYFVFKHVEINLL